MEKKPKATQKAKKAAKKDDFRNFSEVERLSEIIENNRRLAKLHCKMERAEKEEPNLTKQCAICGKPVRNDLTFCSSACIREYRARNG